MNPEMRFFFSCSWYFLVLLIFFSLNSCADEAEEGRKLCKHFGSLCQEADEGDAGEVYLSVYGASGVSSVNLSELGGPATARIDGIHERIQPGTGNIYWNSSGTQHSIQTSVYANSGQLGKYALLIKPPGRGSQGKTRIYKLFLSGSYWAFVTPDE